MSLPNEQEFLAKLGPKGCPLCGQTMINPTETPCRHIFCLACARTHFNTSSTCAVCGTVLYQPEASTPPRHAQAMTMPPRPVQAAVGSARSSAQLPSGEHLHAQSTAYYASDSQRTAVGVGSTVARDQPTAPRLEGSSEDAFGAPSEHAKRQSEDGKREGEGNQ